MMKFFEQEISGVWVIEPVLHGDARGYFAETFRQDLFDRAVGHVDFVQDNESVSVRGVVRGLHFQRDDAAQAKLVRVTSGAILDVVVDIRPGSATFGQHLAVELSADNHRQLFVPRGMAHGFAVLSEKAHFIYKVDNYYCPQAEATLLFNDPALGIDWKLAPEEMILSAKDLAGVPLSELF